MTSGEWRVAGEQEPLFGAGLSEDASKDGNRPSHRSSGRADHKAIARNNFESPEAPLY